MLHTTVRFAKKFSVCIVYVTEKFGSMVNIVNVIR